MVLLQFAELEDSPGKTRKITPPHRKHASVPRERVFSSLEEAAEQSTDSGRDSSSSGSSRRTPRSIPRSERNQGPESANIHNGYVTPKDSGGTSCKAHLLRSASIGASKCTSMHTPKYKAGVFKAEFPKGRW